MRLSMWVLADWLAEYNPDVMIQRGSRTLRNVRLLPDGAELSRTTVYLDSDESGNVLCINDRDMIALPTSDIDHVLNDILDAFEHYNEWEDDLYDSIGERCGVQELIESAAQELNRFFVISDATFFLRNTAGDIRHLGQHPFLLKTMEERSMPLDVILRINEMDGVRSQGKGTYMLGVDQFTKEHPPAVTNLFVNGAHEGWLLSFSSEQPASQGARDLQDAFATILEACLREKRQDNVRMDRLAVLSELLDGERPEQESTYRRLATLGWNRDDAKVVYVVRQIETGKNPQHVIERFLEQIDMSSIVVSHAGDQVCFANASLSNLKWLQSQMQKTLLSCGCSAGRSSEFCDIYEVRAHYLTAKVASAHATTAGTIVSFQDAKLDYALSLIREHAAASISHDALATLESYDRETGADYLKTLEVFLRNERNATVTARELFIHRSTLLYRIERITEMTGVDFDDHEERLLLELSFLLR